jgi:hypothetical protein
MIRSNWKGMREKAEEVNSTKAYIKIMRLSLRISIILPLVLYWCKIWSLTLRNENRLGGDRRVLRGIFGGNF